MFCSSLRKRPEWAAAVRTLATGTSQLKESKLNTHDIAVPLPQPGHVLRLLLLVSGDLDTPATEQRLERLYHLNGGQDAAVVFLVDPRGQDRDPMEAFMKLQVEMLAKFDMPLIPLPSATDLPKTLAALRTSQPTPQPGGGAASLLQHMASGRGSGAPLSEHSANLLSELGRVPSEVAALSETEQGRARLVDLLGEADGARVLTFLAREDLVLT